MSPEAKDWASPRDGDCGCGCRGTGCAYAVGHCCCAGCGCRGRRDGTCGHGNGGHGNGGHGGPGGGGSGDGPPRRPGREPGTDRGDLGNGPLTTGDLGSRPPPRSWPGPRKDLQLPFLFMRANPGDTGSRPSVGPFWESPDVMLLAGVRPEVAPEIPPALGQVAIAGQPTTIYAHVWNFGHAGAHDVIVEFLWCDPSLGVNPAGAHVIGRKVTSLGARGSGKAHRVVKCPDAWVPLVNGGHECLLVRVWDVVSDHLTTPEWDASVNRHLGQRNIHVAAAASLASEPLAINVGPLFGVPSQVAVERAHPAAVPWLQLHTGVRGGFPAPAPVTGDLGISLNGGVGADRHDVTTDGAQVLLTATDGPPPPGTAHVYRVTASAGGAAFGGYTVVVLG